MGLSNLEEVATSRVGWYLLNFTYHDLHPLYHDTVDVLATQYVYIREFSSEVTMALLLSSGHVISSSDTTPRSSVHTTTELIF